MKFQRFFLTLLAVPMLIPLTGCMPTVQSGSGVLVTSTPTANEAMQQDSAAYARQLGISQEEALQRMSIQDEIGELGAALQREQTDTFAGLWTQHEPEYRFVVAFTRDGELTIQPYLKDKPWAHQVEVRTFPHSLAELEAAQHKVMQVAETLDIPTTGSISITANRVTIQVGNPQLFLNEVQSTGQELPTVVDVIANDPNQLTDTLRGSVATYTWSGGRTIYFPMQAPTNIHLAALMEGTLILDQNGCLRVKGEGSDVPLVLWRYGFSLRLQGDTIEVIDENGQVMGRVGEPIRMGGGNVPNPTGEGLPITTCPGPYWALGDIEPLAG